MSKTSFNGYKYFNDIICVELRTWNRCCTYWNIIKDDSLESAVEYLKGLDQISRQQVKRMFDQIKVSGPQAVRQGVVKAATKSREARNDSTAV